MSTEAVSTNETRICGQETNAAVIPSWNSMSASNNYIIRLEEINRVANMISVQSCNEDFLKIFDRAS